MRSWIATFLVCAPLVAAAQPKQGGDATTAAKDLVNKAMTKAQAGDHAAAADLYQQAYALAPLPLLLTNIGSEYEALDQAVEALKYFCKYLEVEPTGPNASYATLQARQLQGKLHNPVDDATVCKPPPASPPVTPPPVTPAVTAPPITDPHHFDLDRATELAHERGRGRRIEIVGATVGVVGVALAAVGVVYGKKAQDISDSITNHDPHAPWQDDITAYEARGQSDEHKQIGFLIGGGVAVAAGVAVFVVGHHHRAVATREAQQEISIVPGPGSLTVFGRF